MGSTGIRLRATPRFFLPIVASMALAGLAGAWPAAADDLQEGTAMPQEPGATTPVPTNLQTPKPASSATSRAQSAHRSHGSLEERVQLISRELHLDPDQEAHVRQILLDQRAEVSKVWDNSAVPAAQRVGATQAITERTADRIRAILTEEQKTKYLKARSHDTPVGAPGGDVEKWITATQVPPAPPAPEIR
jgi:periplasmic protein CpxP/Spy